MAEVPIGAVSSAVHSQSPRGYTANAVASGLPLFEGFAEDQALETNNQKVIPYINAEEARNMFDVLHTADGLRMLVYDIIRRYSKKQRSVCIDVDTYPLEVRVLIRKELEFKGFSVYVDTVAIPRFHISW